MSAPSSLQDLLFSAIIAAAIGFFVGRTRETSDVPGKPGIRDFVILAMLGAAAGITQQPAFICVIGILGAGFLAVLRFQHPERTGITSELAGLMTYVLGVLCLSTHVRIAAALGILLAMILSLKEQLHGFALKTISRREFDDTLKFLALIFLVFPLLPDGRYGPFGFFEPRKIWFFVILVSAVSFVGYFLTRFTGSEKGVTLSAVVGGLASTTAFTGGAAKAVGENAGLALPMSRAALLANCIMYPRVYVILAATAPSLAQAAVPMLIAMFVAGAVVAFAIRGGMPASSEPATAGFQNPFALRPALKFGVLFTIVLCITRVASHYFGHSGQLVAAGIGGLMDVDAVLLSTAESHGNGGFDKSLALGAIWIAITSNAVFKSGLAIGSGNYRFYARIIAGFLVMVLAGLVVLLATG